MGALERIQNQRIEIKASVVEGGNMTITTAQMMDGQIVAVSKENSNNISFMGVSEGMDPIYRMMGLGNEDPMFLH